MVHPKQDDYHKGKDPVPETKGVEDGSAKRNIVRKSNPYDKQVKKNHGGGGGKGKWNDLDDGSLDVDAGDMDDAIDDQAK